MAALVIGTVGALVTSLTGAGASGHRPGAARQRAQHRPRPPRPPRTLAEAARPASARRAPAGGGLLARSASKAGTSVPSGRGASTGGGLPARAAGEAAPLVTDLAGDHTSKRGMPAPPMSAAMRRADAIRQAAAGRYLRHARPPAARVLAATARPQARGYFCGPATVSEMLAQMGVRLTQRAAARQLGTTSAGTDWSDSRGYPVPRVLNAHQRLNRYVAVGLPWSPTMAQVRTYERDLVADVSRGPGVPIAGNAYEVPGGPHLVGHPPGLTILHWFDIRGYAQSGRMTYYEDSVHGAPGIGWGGNVPAYSEMPSVTIVYILGARGYVW